MYGITLPRMSNDGTPGYPAPETACIVVMKICSMPNAACSGASAIAAPVAAQLALVTIAPRHPRRARCVSNAARCDALTSGITSGTSLSMRKFFALLSTMRPARANAGSISPAAAASSAENTMGA
jgi:hypothetical protein